MRRWYFHVLMAMRTHPESQARITKPSPMFAASELRPRFRVRMDTRMMIGMRATVMRVQSSAMKPA